MEICTRLKNTFVTEIKTRNLIKEQARKKQEKSMQNVLRKTKLNRKLHKD